MFQPGGVLSELSSRLLVYYHPKACSATTVYDLSPTSVKGKGASARFKGGCYAAFRLKVSMRYAQPVTRSTVDINELKPVTR